jgi:anthranilate phosphoribosyltransferase
VNIKDAIARVVGGGDLARDDIAAVFGQIMDGEATPAQIGGLLVALRMKGETAEELAGAAQAMRARAVALQCPHPERGVDTCGTGGDGAGTVNISTLAAIVAASCGAVVAKHGNRAQSSRSGSADVLEALGVRIDGSPAVVERCMREAGIGFAFAPAFHAATRHAAGPRKELGTRTLFNLLGPMTNPAQVRHQVVGVFDARWCAPVAEALGRLGARRAIVLHGEGGLDEVSVAGRTRIAEWTGRGVETRDVTPADFGYEDGDAAQLAGGDAAHNAEIVRRLLRGEGIEPGGPLRAVLQAVVMETALALHVIEAAAGGRTDLPHLARTAEGAIREGRAAETLGRWARTSQEPA